MTDRQITVNVTPAEGNINVTFGQAIHKVQADYDQQDSSAASYIKNKPPKYQSGDGVIVDNVTGKISIDTSSEIWEEKQDTVTAGTGINIEDNEISVDIDSVISAGDGITFTDGEIAIDTSTASNGNILYAVEREIDGVVKTVVRWGIPPTGNYVDLTNKPSINGVTLIGNKTPEDLGLPIYMDMSGASATTPGTSGLVPAPAAGDNKKFLRGDGTWGEVEVTDTKYTAGENIAIDESDNNKISVSSSGMSASSILFADGNGGARWGSEYVRSVNGVSGTVSLYPKSGTGERSLFFTPDIAASKTSGSYSEAHGRQTEAAGSCSTAFGLSTRALNTSATTFGRNTLAYQDCSEAHGIGTIASGVASVAHGSESVASGQYSASFGGGSVASGANSFAIGDRSRAEGTGSFASGNQSTASGVYSAATGQGSALGDYSFASGYGAATGNQSAAFGLYASASGNYSFATGWNTKATGVSSMAVGRNSTASGAYSFAAGGAAATQTNSAAFGQARAEAFGSFAAGGVNAIASERYSAIFGQNGTTPVGALFTVANGILTPSTAFNIYVNGDIEANAEWTPTADNHLATKKYVDDNAGGTPDWSNIQNKPTSYPPSAHTHTYSEIINTPDLSVYALKSYVDTLVGNADTLLGSGVIV